MKTTFIARLTWEQVSKFTVQQLVQYNYSTDRCLSLSELAIQPPGAVKAGVRCSELKITAESIALKRTVMLGLKSKKLQRKILNQVLNQAIKIAKQAADFSVKMFNIAVEADLEAQRLVIVRKAGEEAARVAAEEEAARQGEANHLAKLVAIKNCAAAAQAASLLAQQSVEAAMAPLLAAPILQAALSTVWSKLWVVQTKRARLRAEERRREAEVKELIVLEAAAVKKLRAWWKTEEGKAAFEEEKQKLRHDRLMEKKAIAALGKLDPEAQRRAQVRSVFDEFDTDKSDNIDMEEFGTILRELCMPMAKVRTMHRLYCA
jgi:hypothetical protein